MAAIPVEWERTVDSEPEEPENDEWGFDAVSKWWNSSCNDGCKKAERALIKAFVDTDIYEFRSAEVAIDYDAEPVSVKQKKLQRSRTFSFFSSTPNNNAKDPIHRSFTSANHSTSALPRVHEQSQPSQPSQPSASSSCKKEKTCSKKSKTDPLALQQEVIHTLSFRIKPDKVQTLKDRLYAARANDNDNEAKSDTESDEEISHPPVDTNAVNNDNQANQGRPFRRFFQLTESPEGSSSLPALQKQLSKCTKLRLRAQQQANDDNDNNGYPDIVGQKQMPPIVISHGYGCAGGIFIPSISTIYETLLSHLNVEEPPVIHVFDWLGAGMSSRPPFQCEDTQEAEDWFVESLEAWRKAMGIGKMILSAHSLGGYAASCYAMRYPQFIEHLILISPCGVPPKPDDAEIEKMLDNYSWKIRTMFKTFGKLWNSGWTPHDVIRMSGPKARGLVENIVNKRLTRVDDNDPLKPLLAEYLYHVIAQPGSGEYALNKILAPGAWARNPLATRMGALKAYQKEVTGYDLQGDGAPNEDVKQDEEEEEEEEEEKKDASESDSSRLDVDKVMNANMNKAMKIDFIYGTTDWMTSAHAVKLKLDRVVKCDVYITPDCGHQLILENRHGFAQLFGAVLAKGQIISAAQ